MDIVYFDLETQRSANDVGGWGHKDRMGMSVGVTYSTALGTYKIYAEHQAEELIEQLKNADLVIGYNHLYFDYAVLQAYSVFEIEAKPVTSTSCSASKKHAVFAPNWTL